MKFDSYTRFLKSLLYQECMLAEVEGRPLPDPYQIPSSPTSKHSTTGSDRSNLSTPKKVNRTRCCSRSPPIPSVTQSLFWNTEDDRAGPYLTEVYFLREGENMTNAGVQRNLLNSLRQYTAQRFPHDSCASGDLLSTCCRIQPHVNTWPSPSEGRLKTRKTRCSKHCIISNNVEEITLHRILLNWDWDKPTKKWNFG